MQRSLQDLSSYFSGYYQKNQNINRSTPLILPSPQEVSNFSNLTSALFNQTKPTVNLTASSIAAYIDHTLLKPEATQTDIELTCNEALRYNFSSVCVNSYWINLVAKKLSGSKTKPIAVIGFPLGAMATAAKTAETQIAISQGAEEIDMVINVGAIKSKQWDSVFWDIADVVTMAQKTPVKVILETCLLTTEEKIISCLIAQLAKAAYVKTSTGFSKGGATTEDVFLMRAVVGSALGVKASGGIRTTQHALTMIAAGASRLGTSQSVSIVTDHDNSQSTGSY